MRTCSAIRVCLFTCVALIGCAARATRTTSAQVPEATRACETFGQKVEFFGATLVRSDSAPPKADPAKSPSAAREMVRAARACLETRGVRIKMLSDLAIEIEPGGTQTPSNVASAVLDATRGTVVYDGEFFLKKPYAAAAFDKDINRLSLPHSAISGELGKVLRHELLHVHSLELLNQHARARHLLISNATTKPDALSVDEVFAYAGTSTAPELSAEDRGRSRRMAEQYLTFVSHAAADPTSTFRIEARSVTCRPTEALLAQLRNALDCVGSRLAGGGGDFDSCDTTSIESLCEPF